MISSRWRWDVLLGLAAGACRSGDDLAAPDDLVAPRGLKATPINLRAIRIQWNAVPGAQLYRLERRVNLTGDFTRIAPNVPQSLPGPVSYLDTAVDPETFYGYRVVAVDRLGKTSETSAVSGARTPSLPSIDVVTLPIQDGANLIEDPDGYTVVVAGPDTVRRAVPSRAIERIGPLRVGSYSVSLEGVANNCRPGASPVRVAVSDTGTNTVSVANFPVTCRDKTRGEIVVAIRLDGEPPTGAQFRVDVTGIASDQTLPTSQRAFAQTLRFAEGGAPERLRDLRPGDYQLELDSLPTTCAVEGQRRRDVDVKPLSLDSLLFAVRCGGGGGGNQNRPFVLRNRWTPRSVASGNVDLRLSLDLSATPNAAVGAVEGTLRYDQQLLRFERIEAIDTRFNVVGNGTTPGVVAYGAFTTTPGITGDAPIAKMVFTVTGGAGTRAVTRSSDVRATLFDFTQIDTLVRVAEDTLTIGSGQGSNVPPTAKANGPYSGAVGVPITFSAAGSLDSDGSIASYAWDFGDGTTGTGVSTTKTYTTVGNFAVKLTVTDDGGATALDQTTAAITSGSTSPPTWKATFGTVDAATSTLPLTITYDLSGDVAATPGPEALETWALDSLKWDPAVLRFFAVSFGAGVTGTVDPTAAFAGKLKLGGTQSASNRTGILTLATVRFRVVGSGGSSTTTSTALGALTGTAATGTFAYRPITVVQEATYSVPGGGGSQTGTVTGTVTRSSGGTIAGATVTVTPGGTTTTNSSGRYTVSNVAVGSGTVTVSGLPSGCTAPAAKQYTLTGAGQTATVDFTVTCGGTSSTGTVRGVVRRSGGGAALAGATVTAAPGGSATTNATGQYSILNVPVGNGSVTVANLPSGCTAPAAKPYAIASAGQSVDVDFDVTCAVVAGNSVLGKWTVSGSTATLEIRASVVSGNVGTIEGTFDAGSSRLQYTGSSVGTSPSFPNVFATNPPATKISFGALTTASAGLSGDVGIIKFTFAIQPGAATTVNGTLVVSQAADASLKDVTPTFAGRVTVEPLTLP